MVKEGDSGSPFNGVRSLYVQLVFDASAFLYSSAENALSEYAAVTHASGYASAKEYARRSAHTYRPEYALIKVDICTSDVKRFERWYC